ncbi:MAG: transporter [Opitutae bacterium]|nr:transporter [Opitutae bacterium]
MRRAVARFLPLVRVCCGALCASGAIARGAAAGGPSWTSPVPREQMRALSSDRPDATESPYTVDAGHVQLEASFLTHTRVDALTTVREIAPVNVRVGLANAFELQFVFDGLIRTRTSDPRTGVTETRSGSGDLTVRAKFNCRGNDGGVAVGVMPFVKLPTNSGGIGNRSLEGGVIVPLAFGLGAWTLGAMTEVDCVRDAAETGYAAVWINTVTVGHGLTERLAGFAELASGAGDGGHAFGFNCGLTYAVSADLQLDCGANFGLSRAAPDRVLFVGITSRY